MNTYVLHNITQRINIIVALEHFKIVTELKL